MTLDKAKKIIESYPNTKIINVHHINVVETDSQTLLLGTIIYLYKNKKYIFYIREDSSEKIIKEIMENQYEF